MVVGMDEYSTSPSFDFGKNIEECEQVGDALVVV